MSELVDLGLLKFRKAIDADMPYIRDSWGLAAFSHIESEQWHLSSSAQCAKCKAHLYDRRQHADIDFTDFAPAFARWQSEIIRRSKIMIAHPSDDAAQVLGYIVHEPGDPHILHWLQVKRPFWEHDIGTAMLKQVGIDRDSKVKCTLGTPLWSRLKLKWGYKPYYFWERTK